MKIGTRLFSGACEGEVIVIRAQGITEPLLTDGIPMVTEQPETRQTGTKGEGFALGKRYEFVDEDKGIKLEVLVSKPGNSTLTWDGHPLTVKQTKPLPASD